MAIPKSYKVTYLDNNGKKQVETTQDTISFYQRARAEGLTIIKVEKTWQRRERRGKENHDRR